MIPFSTAPRFEVLTDGTVYARAGVQTNCGGIAGIHVRITKRATPGIMFQVSTHEARHTDSYGSTVPGFAIPTSYCEAVFRGAQDALTQSASEVNVEFELLDALVHPVDANERQFAIAGTIAMRGWLELHAQG